MLSNMTKDLEVFLTSLKAEPILIKQYKSINLLALKLATFWDIGLKLEIYNLRAVVDTYNMYVKRCRLYSAVAIENYL